MNEKPITSRLTAKGQTTIPQEVREILKLQPGDTIRFVVLDDAVEIIARNKPASSLFGRLSSYSKAGTDVADYRNSVDAMFSEDEDAPNGDVAA